MYNTHVFYWVLFCFLFFGCRDSNHNSRNRIKTNIGRATYGGNCTKNNILEDSNFQNYIIFVKITLFYNFKHLHSLNN